jgi:hypothetical protein
MALFFSKTALASCMPLLLMAGWACNTSEKKAAKIAQASRDSAEACTPIKDPNNPKPMALMMRQMATNADSIRAGILMGIIPDSLKYPFLRFYLVEPTDPGVLEPQFFENARLYQQAYRSLMNTDKAEMINAYNATIAACINCHQRYCSGPLKRINKLPITGLP